MGEDPPGTRDDGTARARLAAPGGARAGTRTAGTASTVILTRPPGYELRVEPGALDLVRFEQLATEGRSLLEQGECSAAADRLREGLGLWRGAALAGTAETPSSSAGALRLEERRLEAIEDRVDADIALGRHARIVSELEELVEREPFRERLCGQLMLALYRSGHGGWMRSSCTSGRVPGS